MGSYWPFSDEPSAPNSLLIIFKLWDFQFNGGFSSFGNKIVFVQLIKVVFMVLRCRAGRCWSLLQLGASACCAADPLTNRWRERQRHIGRQKKENWPKIQIYKRNPTQMLDVYIDQTQIAVKESFLCWIDIHNIPVYRTVTRIILMEKTLQYCLVYHMYISNGLAQLVAFTQFRKWPQRY